ncbi:hypothetical protein KAI31_05250 [Candidatus Bathyarchaeota archaeon]|nr:hypothetical protein [Candidatus Bathyarchaeota archaeon]
MHAHGILLWRSSKCVLRDNSMSENRLHASWA